MLKSRRTIKKTRLASSAGSSKYPLTDKARQYAEDVLSGKIDACKYVKLACKRHLDDLAKAKDKNFPYYWSPAASEKVLQFIQLMPHVKAKWAGQPIRLEAFQCFIVGVPFGWLKKKDDKRRFREKYVELSRKNGKTLIEAAIGLYMLTMDGEEGAEIYCGASTEDQAWEVFGPARQMALKSPDFRKYFKVQVLARSLNILSTMAKFRPVIGEPPDGSSPSYAISDECHQHKTDAFRNTMKTGMGTRDQPMLSEITTAGEHLDYPSYERSVYVKKVLEGLLVDDELFGIIYTIDAEDDWRDFSCWPKANPNYGISLTEDYLKSQHRAALAKPYEQNMIKCKHLNVWGGSSSAWLNMAKWLANKTDLTIEAFAGRECFVAADYASKIDLSAVMFLFPDEVVLDADEDGNPLATRTNYYLFGLYYLPSETVEGNKNYERWRDEGKLIVTEGARTDFNRIEDDIYEYAAKYRFKVMGFDPKEATKLMTDISSKSYFDCVEINQSAVHFSEPMKDFESMVESGRLLTSKGDSIIDWAASNVVLRQYRNKTYYPQKESAANKIDPIVAGIMTFRLAMNHESFDPCIMVI